MSSCPIDISHAGTILNPISLFTLLTSLTNHTHVHSLLFHNEEHEFDLNFHPSMTVFTPEEQANFTQRPFSFCHFDGSSRQLGFRAWLSVCDQDEMTMIMHTPSTSVSLDHANDTFQMKSSNNDSCDLLWRSSKKRHVTLSKFRVTEQPFPPHSLPKYYKEYSHLFERKRYVELAMFGDVTLWEKYSYNFARANERMRNALHIANSYFASLRIEVQLVHIHVYTSLDEMKIDYSGIDTQMTSFKKFLANWKTSKIFDHAALFTRDKGNDHVVGFAEIATICFPESTHVSYSWTYDGQSLIRVAKTFAHELGHTLGIEHDVANNTFGFEVCECPQASCMHGNIDDNIDSRHWSNCSLGYLDKMYKTGSDYCLWNHPGNNTLQPFELFQFCGDGIVDKNEECDCGQDGCITHDCCDPITCKLRENAQCAAGSCCDLSTCSISTDLTKVCRSSKNTCDYPELCDGMNSECPIDRLHEDGETCPDDKNAICYKGRCGSRLLQCKEIWGDYAPPGNESCYYYNGEESKCGWKTDEWDGKCAEEDKPCGLLYCYPGRYAYSNLYGWEKKEWGGGTDCRSVLVEYRTDYVPDYHLGMSPNGASCGDGKYCLKSKCVSKMELLGCQLKHFYNEDRCDVDRECVKPIESNTTLQCATGFGLQADLNNGSWIDVSSVTCVDQKYEIVSEKGDKVTVFAEGFQCANKSKIANHPSKENTAGKESAATGGMSAGTYTAVILIPLILITK